MRAAHARGPIERHFWKVSILSSIDSGTASMTRSALRDGSSRAPAGSRAALLARCAIAGVHLAQLDALLEVAVNLALRACSRTSPEMSNRQVW